MFEIDDDFDLDEVSLDSVLLIEQGAIPVSNTSQNKCVTSRSEIIQPSVKCPVKRKISDDDLKSELNSRSSKLLESGMKCAVQEDNSRNEATTEHSRMPSKSVSHHTDSKALCGSKGGDDALVVRRTISGACRRKFPGPAGLLPERPSRVLYSSGLSESENKDAESEEEVPLFSEACSALDVGPWQALRYDLREADDFLSKYTVAWVKQRAAARRLAGQKVPLLAAVLHNVDSSSPDPAIVLRDKTGVINGTVHRSVWECHGGQLVQGSALVLRHVGVLSTPSANQRHYVNVTSNNLVTIYSPTSDGDVKVTEVNTLDFEEMRILVEEWEAKCRAAATTTASASAQSPSLFASTLPSRYPLHQIAATLPHRKATGAYGVSGITSSPQIAKAAQQRITRVPLACNKSLTTASDAVPSVVSESQRVPAFKPKTSLIKGPSVPAAINPTSVNGIATLSTEVSDADALGLEVSSILDGLDTDQLFSDF